MMSRFIATLIFCFVLVIAAHAAATQVADGVETNPVGKPVPQTVGLFLNDPRSFSGYTLFAPLQYNTTYLIDNDGTLIHRWRSDYKPGNSAYLLSNGNLLRTATLERGKSVRFQAGGAGGRVEEFSWNGSLIWAFEYASEQHLLHHDIERLPNGTILMIAWEYKSEAEAISAGRDPSLLADGELWPDHIIEVQPTGSRGGTIVWEWHSWNHLVQDRDPTKENYGNVSAHPELIDINFDTEQGRADWTHTNAIEYNVAFDQILLSARCFNEIWVIDHSTSTGEAAGHTGGNYGKGGDLLYRWGNPQTYRAGTAQDQKFFGQHDAQWIASGLAGEGNMLVFNNGWDRPEGAYSSVEEITPPVDDNGTYMLSPGTAYKPSQQWWIYTATPQMDFYADHISGAQRLPNGNTLICDGTHGTFFEITPENEIVWRYINPVTNKGPLVQGRPIPSNHVWLNTVFRAYRYAPDYSAFEGKDMTPGAPIEFYPHSGFEADNNPYDTIL